LRYPVLIKPKQGGGAWGIRQIESEEELKNLLNSDDYLHRPWSRFFIQEKVVGDTHCVAMLLNKGALRATVAYKQLRDYPVTGGQATMRVSVRNVEAEQCLERLLEHLHWNGVCQADFIVEPHTGKPYLIDLNPRLWGSLAQAIASGVDFPFLIYQLAKEGDVAPVTGFKTGVVTRWIGGELGTFFPHLRNTSKKLEFLRQFLHPPTRATLYDDFSLADPVPFLVWLGDAAFRALKFRTLKPTGHESLEGIWK
jgi:predicted ATP-grasp superfamily ATP-dependent carboligase